jgi:CheY-like chemotaxis protein
MYVLSFHSRGYTVYEADDGLDGMTKAAMHQPTIIILDIMMPHMDGFEVLHALKNNTSIRPIVIVNSNLE